MADIDTSNEAIQKISTSIEYYADSFQRDYGWHRPVGEMNTAAKMLRALCSRIEALEANWAIATNPEALHQNLLRGQPCQLSRMTFLHLAGATDYDALKTELDALQAQIDREGR